MIEPVTPLPPGGRRGFAGQGRRTERPAHAKAPSELRVRGGGCCVGRGTWDVVTMSLGYNRPLYLLPFDRRYSYITDMCHFTPPLDAEQHAAVADSKRVIYDGFLEAVESGLPRDRAGILVDEEFGAELLRDAARVGCVTAVSTESSGSDEFEFEYGAAFAQHIAAVAPTFAKVLVRYNPEGDAALNRRQTARLKQLSDYCRGASQPFMFELLVPATPAQLDRVQGQNAAYDLRLRPELMLATIRTLQDAGVEPDVWKIEGLDRAEDCERIVGVARRYREWATIFEQRQP